MEMRPDGRRERLMEMRPDECPRCGKIQGNEVIEIRDNVEVWMCKGEKGCLYSWRINIDEKEFV